MNEVYILELYPNDTAILYSLANGNPVNNVELPAEWLRHYAKVNGYKIVMIEEHDAPRGKR